MAKILYYCKSIIIMGIAAIRSCGGSTSSTFLVNTTGASFVANNALRQRRRGYSSWMLNVKTQVPLHRRREVSLPVHSAVMSSSPIFSSAVENKQVSKPLVVCGPRKVRICVVLSCAYVCSMWSLGDLATSFVPPLHSCACPCNPHVLTYAMFTSPRLHKLCNAHLPE